MTCGTVGLSVARAQDQNVAEAARQERARKQQQQKPAGHVYTNEDLKRQDILTPEDQVLVQARKSECAQKNGCGPAPQHYPPAALDATSHPQQPSLGEVARQLRKQKELQALKPQQSAPFHLEVPAPALAAPVVPARRAIRLPTPPVLGTAGRPESRTPVTVGNIVRRDPFARVPSRPRVSLGDGTQLHPLRPPVLLVAPLAPKLSPTAVAPAKPLAQPSQSPAPEAPRWAPPALRIQSVRPSIPLTRHRATLLPAPASIFPFVEPLALPSAKPGAPNAPGTAIQPVEPRRAVTSPSSFTTRSDSAKTIRVQLGDSLWRLAQRHFGRGSLWPQILALNPSITDPNQLSTGSSLRLPAVIATRTAETKKAANSQRTIKVAKGDTLWSLAKANLGRFTHWRCLAAANPSIASADLIFAGQELFIPATCKLSSPRRSHSAKE